MTNAFVMLITSITNQKTHTGMKWQRLEKWVQTQSMLLSTCNAFEKTIFFYFWFWSHTWKFLGVPTCNACSLVWGVIPWSLNNLFQLLYPFWHTKCTRFSLWFAEVVVVAIQLGCGQPNKHSLKTGSSTPIQDLPSFCPWACHAFYFDRCFLIINHFIKESVSSKLPCLCSS